MEIDTIQIDVTELNRAANLVSHVAQRRTDLGQHGTQTLFALANLILQSMLALAFGEPPNGATMQDDTTPTDDRAVLKPDDATKNRFMVGRLESTVIITALSPRRLSRDEALNLAAWLLKMSDEPVAFEQFTLNGAVVSVEFAELLEKVQRT